MSMPWPLTCIAWPTLLSICCTCWRACQFLRVRVASSRRRAMPSFFCCVSACTHTYTHIHISKHSLTQYVVYYTYFPIRALRRPNDPCLHVSALSTGPFPRNVVVAFFCEYANISIENGYQPVTQPTTFILLSGVNWALTRAAPNPHVSRPRLAFSWHSYIHHTHQ